MAGEWKTRPLGELTDNFDNIRVPVKETDRKPGPYPYYGASGVVDTVDQFLFDGEYLLIGEDGENLRTRNTPVAFLAQGKFWVNNHAHIVRGKQHEGDTRYLMYALAGTDISGYLTGSTMPKLTQGNMNRIPVIAPPLKEQQAIACVLGALDDKIELNRRRNHTLEAMARAIFQNWFVDFDPVRAKTDGRAPVGLSKEVAALFPDSFEESALGPIPKGWQIKTLGELTTKIGSGATPRGGEKVYVDEGIAFVRSQNIYDFEFRWEGLARLAPEAAADLDGVALEPEDILFNITGASILRTCVVDPAVLPARVNQHVARIRAKPDVPSRFLHLNLVRDQMKQHLLGLNAGATREAVTKGHLQSIRLVVPPQSILQQFAKLIGPLYAQKDTSLHQSRTLAALRDTLLPKLISGELLVPDAERIVARST